MAERNGTAGRWAERCRAAKPIDIEIKQSCLQQFRQGTGYHKTARAHGLSPYTVRDWHRRFLAGDEAWAHRDGWRHWGSIEARDLLRCSHALKTGDTGVRAPHASDGSIVASGGSFAPGTDQAVGAPEPVASLALCSAARSCEELAARFLRKKKELDAVEALVASRYRE